MTNASESLGEGRWRAVAVVGRRAPRSIFEVVFRCSWCGLFRSEEDAARAARGVAISHGCCAKCEAAMLAQIP